MTAASAAALAVCLCALPAFATEPATADGMTGEPVLGSVIALDVSETPETGAIMTEVVTSGSSGITAFSMPGGEIDGRGMWTERFTQLAVGETIVVALAVAEDGTAQAVEAPVVLSVSAQMVTDYIYDGKRWDDSALPVGWRFNSAGAPAGALAAIQAAAQTWEDDAGSLIDYTYQGTTGAVPDVSDDTNSVGFSADSPGGQLAHCTYWYELTKGSLGYDRLVEFDINFNKAYTWSTSPGQGQFDIQSVALHELGHTLVLDDLHDNTSTAKDMVMNGSILAGATVRALADGDVAGVRAIYPGAVAPPPPPPPPPPAGDTEPPAVSCDAVAAYVGSASVRITASDAGSGVSQLQWSLDGGATSSAFSSSAMVRIETPGTHTLRFVAVDNAGNRGYGSAVFSVTVPDGAPPVTVHAGAPSAWTSATVTISLSASDSGSGVALTYYRVGAGPIQAYTKPLVVADEGMTTVAYWSADNAGNTESERSVTFGIDRTAPVAQMPEATVFSAGTTLTVPVADGVSGIARAGYRVGGADWVASDGAECQVPLSMPGTYTVAVFAEDAASNRTERSATVTVLGKVTLRRTPGESRYTVRRRSGVARWTTTAILKTVYGVPLAGVPVALQKRRGEGWATVSTVRTDDAGRVSKRLSLRARGTTQWRWYVKGDGLTRYPAASSSARVTVR